MTDSNLKDITTTWVTMGFLILTMIAFAGQFMSANAPGTLGETEGVFNDLSANLTSNLIQVQNDSNTQINISSLVNSQNQNQGLFVSTTNAYGFFGTVKKFFQSTFRLLYFVLPQPFAGIFVTMFAGLLSFMALFYIIKLGRSIF